MAAGDRALSMVLNALPACSPGTSPLLQARTEAGVGRGAATTGCGFGERACAHSCLSHQARGTARGWTNLGGLGAGSGPRLGVLLEHSPATPPPSSYLGPKQQVLGLEFS